MCEFIFKDLVAKEGLSDMFEIASAGTSAEEEGNPVYPLARAELERHGISCAGKRARRLTASDYRHYDHILAMESRNVAGILRIVGGDPQNKIARLLDFSPRPRDIADPWYTRDFSSAYADIKEGALCFLEYLCKNGKIQARSGRS